MADFEIKMTDPSAVNFVRVSWVTENKTKKGEIERHRSIFCCTDEQLEWLSTAKHLKIDGTFKVAGEPFYQLVSLHRMVDFGHCSKSVPVGFIIMSGKTQADYTAIFQQIKLYVEQKQLAGATWNVETAMLDFELALRNALKSVFVGIHLQGCWFHYCQAIWRRVHHLKLDGEYPHKAHGGKYIKRIMSLALMNANGSMIESMFEMLQHNYRSKDRHHLTIPVQQAFDELFAYVAKQWIYNPKLPTSELSVFDTPVRTNNEVENWNGQLWNTVNGNPQSFYKLLKVLKKVSVSSRQEVRSKLRNSKRSAQIAIDKTIQGIWDKMKDRAIAPKKALYALCQETERNNIMTYNRDMMSYICLDIDKCDVFDE